MDLGVSGRGGGQGWRVCGARCGYGWACMAGRAGIHCVTYISLVITLDQSFNI
jgi:hypothetical protein